MKKNSRRHNENQSISDVLKNFVVANKLQGGIDQVEMENVWQNVMGLGIVNYTTQIKLQNNTLFVQLSSSVLREQLSYGASKIILNINEAFGREIIQKLVLR
ncbi:DUF721 domain-containing protein [Aquimarina agarivorans]|uniref:DUF721 domain-containing protein n=1 Tax=Aquimarina agarivorans TaxID=980584 RepID=UPI000248F5B7|nr:DUF721 domain-containing protein [Aquimarina agarivorans]